MDAKPHSPCGLTPIVSVEGLRISFSQSSTASRVEAVRAIDFELTPGCRTGIIGESGSGKSVTCLALTGLVEHIGGRIDAGRIRTFGCEVLGASEKQLQRIRKQKTAYIFQEPMRALTPHLTVADHFRLRYGSLGIRNVSEVRERTAQVLKEAQLQPDAGMLRSYPRELSGGMAQRVTAALAFAGEPELLIADEPATALDAVTRMRLMETLQEAAASRQAALLIISHDVGLTAAVTESLLVMKDGKIVERGSTAEIIKGGSCPYTKRLIAAVPSLSAARTVTASPGEDAVLELRGVTVRYPNGTEGIRKVSLRFAPGGVTAVAGESGSGKSTLVKACLGLADPSEGTILVDGVSTAEMSTRQLQEARRRMQIVFQNPSGSFNPDLLMRESLQEPLRMLSRMKEPKRIGVISALLRRVGLDVPVLHRFPDQFSGGQKQRMSITRSLSVSPLILFADEPVSSLDVSIQAEVLQLFRELQRSLGFHLVFITHDIASAAGIADRMAVMHRGEIVESGGIEEILTNAKHPYTRKLLAASAWADIHARREGMA